MRGLHTFLKKLKACFASKELTSVVVAFLIYQWVSRTTSYQNMASYYEEKYGMEPHQRGYLSPYSGFIAFLVQSFLVKRLLQRAGGEKCAACTASALLTIVTFVELKANIWIFIVILCPVIATSGVLLNISLRSLISQVAPKSSIGSVVAAVDILGNAVSVTTPIYRTLLFAAIASVSHSVDESAAMKGDPDPDLWLLSSTFHWILTTIIFCCLLLNGKLICIGEMFQRKKNI